MAEQRPKPIVLLAFANEQDPRVPERRLRKLPEEVRRLRETLTGAEVNGLCQLVERTNATFKEIIAVFRDRRYRDRIAVFHFGGHADTFHLLFEGEAGTSVGMNAEGFAKFLAQQAGLQLVFLNACSTAGQVKLLQDAGVPVVIATSEDIPDDIATEFAAEFYKSLAAEAKLRRAFKEAEGVVEASPGAVETASTSPASPASAERHVRPAGQTTEQAEQAPWRLYVLPQAPDAAEWSLPDVVNDPLFGLPPLPLLDLPASPYRHLEWFRREDAHIFFGRGREIAELYRRVTAADGPPIVLFYGQSGVGKSSVLAAGLLPRLEQRHTVIYSRRSRAKGLSQTLADALGASDASKVPDAWRSREQDQEQDQESRAGRLVVLVLDQVEELFTRPNADQPDELERFLDLLGSLFAHPRQRPSGKLILSFRKEWLAEIQRRLEERGLPHARVFLERLDRAGVIEVVKGPVRSSRLRDHFGLRVAPDLPRVIADDLLADRESPVAPMLQILLAGMWDVAKARDYDHPTFDEALYDEVRAKGLGLDDFLTRQLQALRAQHAPAVESGLALDLLAYHTTPLGTAEQRTMSDLQDAYYHQVETVQALVQECRDLYLLVDPSRNQPNLPPASRLTHDTLAPHVRKRFDESDAPGQRARRSLESRAVEWTDGREGTPLDKADLAVVKAGRSGMRGWRANEERMVQASERARVRQAIQLAASLGALVLLAVVAAGFAWWQSQLAASRELAAQATNLPNSQLDRGVLLSLQAYRRGNTVEARSSLLSGLVRGSFLLTFLHGHTGSVRSVAFSPNGKLLASAGSDRTVRLWDVATRRQVGEPLTGHTGSVRGVAFGPDGDLLASAANDSTIRLWEVATGQPAGTLTGHDGEVNGVAFSPDGKLLASAGQDGTVRLWEVGARVQSREPLAGHAGEVNGVAFGPDPDRQLLASAGADHAVRLWDVATRRQVGELTGYSGEVSSVAFSPDRKTLATGSADHAVRLWDVAGGQLGTVRGHTGPVTSVAFSPNGKLLASAGGGDDHAVRLWNVATGQLPDQPLGQPLTSHAGAVNGVAFSPDGMTLASGGDDLVVRLWDFALHAQLVEPSPTPTPARGSFGGSPTPTPLAPTPTPRPVQVWDMAARRRVSEPITGFWEYSEIRRVAFSPNGKLLALAGGADDRTVRLWDVAARRQVGEPLAGHTGAVTSVAFGPDGNVLAAADRGDDRAGRDSTVRLWDVSGRRQVGTLAGQTGRVLDVAFSPDGKLLAAGGDDPTVRLWDVAGRQPAGTLAGHTGPVTGVAFSPDGRLLASSSSDDGTIRLWDVAGRQPAGTLAGHSGAVNGVAFSPDGKLMASAGQDATVRLWDVAARRQLGEPLAGHIGMVLDVAFSPDGRLLASAGNDHSVRLWDVDLESWQARACWLANRNLTRSEWSQYVGAAPFAPYAKTCAESPAGDERGR